MTTSPKRREKKLKIELLKSNKKTEKLKDRKIKSCLIIKTYSCLFRFGFIEVKNEDEPSVAASSSAKPLIKWVKAYKVYKAIFISDLKFFCSHYFY
jgi:hypothetical protein